MTKISMRQRIRENWKRIANDLCRKRLLKRFPAVDPSITLYGAPFLAVSPHSKLTIADHVVLTSDYRDNLAGLCKRCTIFVADGAELSIGSYSGFSGVSIYCTKRVTIGKYLQCGVNTSIWDTDFHPIDYAARRIHDGAKIASEDVVIGNDVFVGANCMILKGVTIGDRAVIGAGSVVTRSVPADEMWAGNPAKLIRRFAG